MSSYEVPLRHASIFRRTPTGETARWRAGVLAAGLLSLVAVGACASEVEPSGSLPQQTAHALVAELEVRFAVTAAGAPGRVGLDSGKVHPAPRHSMATRARAVFPKKASTGLRVSAVHQSDASGHGNQNDSSVLSNQNDM